MYRSEEKTSVENMEVFCIASTDGPGDNAVLFDNFL